MADECKVFRQRAAWLWRLVGPVALGQLRTFAHPTTTGSFILKAVGPVRARTGRSRPIRVIRLLKLNDRFLDDALHQISGGGTPSAWEAVRLYLWSGVESRQESVTGPRVG